MKIGWILGEPLVSVWPNKHKIINSSKNFKLIRTDNTNSTILMIMDVAEEDAGFYGWGNDSAEALSRPGVVLIVHSKLYYVPTDIRIFCSEALKKML